MSASELGVVVMNLGGPDSPEAVEPFLRNLFADPDIIQLGAARFLQPLLARVIAHRRAPVSRAAYMQIGGRSPIREECEAQAGAVAEGLRLRGVAARPYVAMGCWRPFSRDAVAAMRADGIARAVAVSLFPHYSRATVGSSLRQMHAAIDGSGIELAAVERYPTAPGFVAATCDRIREALALLPEHARDGAPVLFSAHGLPEAYIRRGDPYLDDVRSTVAAVDRVLGLGDRARLCFQSRVGPQRWLGPSTEEAIADVASRGGRAVAVCPFSFTGEHVETLQEIDILYRRRAVDLGVEHFARARTVGVHPTFIDTLADLALEAARARGWAA